MKIASQKDRTISGVADAIIPYGTTFKGDVETKSNIHIDGNIKGNVVAAGNVTVGEEGIVEGGVSGKDVSIAGKVTGDLNASGSVHLLSGSKLLGDLLAVNLVMDKGAYFKGMCIIADKQPMLGENTPAKAVK